MRSLSENTQIYTKTNSSALPTLVLALAVWALIFGAAWFAWQLTDFLR